MSSTTSPSPTKKPDDDKNKNTGSGNGWIYALVGGLAIAGCFAAYFIYRVATFKDPQESQSSGMSKAFRPYKFRYNRF